VIKTKGGYAMHIVDGMVIFDTIGTDEVPFANWLRVNTDGYVANIGRGANKYSPVKLHQATCKFMNSETVAKGGFINTDFYKVCSLEGPALVAWLQNGYRLRQWGEPSDDRRFCHPGLLP
jgi:hypothetical protein